MRLRSLCLSFALVLGGLVPCIAQQPSGPATLENLLKPDDSLKPAEPAAAEAADTGLQRPAGTVARPKDGVRHPDLDKAWVDYEATVAKATEAIQAAISKQFDAATAKGDLDAAEKWQAAMEKFVQDGEVPSTIETKAATTTAMADCKKAKDGLAKSYEALVKALTMEKKINEAKALRDEWQAASKAADMTPEEMQAIEPYGLWAEPADDLIRVVAPRGQYIEINRRTGRNHTTGFWRTIAPNVYETQTENGWTIRFRMLDRDRIEFRNTGPDGKVYPPYIRAQE